MFTFPALMTLGFEGVASFNVIVFPTILTGAFQLMERGRGGVSPGSGAPAIVNGAFGGNKGDP